MFSIVIKNVNNNVINNGANYFMTRLKISTCYLDAKNFLLCCLYLHSLITDNLRFSKGQKKSNAFINWTFSKPVYILYILWQRTLKSKQHLYISKIRELLAKWPPLYNRTCKNWTILWRNLVLNRKCSWSPRKEHHEIIPANMESCLKRNFFPVIEKL